MAAVSMIMTEEDYKEKYRRVEENLPYINTEEKVRHCKAEVFENTFPELWLCRGEKTEAERRTAAFTWIRIGCCS